MLNKYSLETLMKWIFMSLAISMVALTLGARLHQSYAEKKKTAGEFGRELSVIYDERKYSLPKEIVMGQLGPFWRESLPDEKPELVINNGGEMLGFNLDLKSIIIALVEEERYLMLVGLLGLIAAVELAVLLSYMLTRPLRRLAWGCRQIAQGSRVKIRHNALSPYEFHELTDSFNEMASELERWKEVQRQVSRMDRLAALGEMISGLSHEIRNPLASIRIQLDLLRMELDVVSDSRGSDAENDISDAKEYISILDHEIDRLNRTVTQLLSFVRPRQPMMAKVLLDDVLPWCISMLKPQAEKEGIELITRKLDSGVTVQADNEMLQHVIMNLSLNAIQSMSSQESGGKKVLSIATGSSATGRGTNKFGMVRVSDTGPGIPAEIQHRIFDPFFTTRQDGTGLGLSIVQRIVDGIGGTLSLDTSSEGTIFNIFIPLAEDVPCGADLQPMEVRTDEHMDS
ncbi:MULTISPECIES: sensor histidine kinase [Synergistaceae]|uniref:sensor histidine kinase n=1 Tax=Synergistaceae TaxID=649777 RepID=UPI003AEBC104|nr:ATP-binding protein [Synergistaceae bacterium DZ-S4]